MSEFGNSTGEARIFGFINPYDFVPMGKDAPLRKEPADVYADKTNLQSGWLDVKLTAKTSLIVPDGAQGEGTDVEGHNTYGFFAYPGSNDPVIPGSELRGMLRSVYEAASNSCMPFLPDEDKPISQRTPTYAAFKDRGLLCCDAEAKQWRLYKGVPAREPQTYPMRKADRQPDCIDDRTGEYCIMGEKVQIDGVDAWTQINSPIINQEGAPYHVYWLKKGSLLKEWLPGDMQPAKQMASVLKQDGTVGNQKDGNAKRRGELLEALVQIEKTGGCIPVWYRKLTQPGETVYYLSNSAIGRVAQDARWSKIMGEHSPCGSKNVGEGLCPACLLFGTVAGTGLKSHVRFTDATAQKVTGKTMHMLEILGNPCPTTYEFYSRKPHEQADNWNFDYYYTSVKDNSGRVIDAQIKPLPEDSGIRGRKMYWHSTPARDAKEKTNLNDSMEAVDAGSEFGFRVYFDEVTEQQLQELLWVVTLGENTADATRLHKLGHAKPLGYGSVKLVVKKCTLRKVKQGEDAVHISLQEKPVEETIPCPFDGKSEEIKCLRAMANLQKTQDKVVCYPQFVDQRTNTQSIYAWFADNQKKKEELAILPYPTDGGLTLAGSYLYKPNGPEPLVTHWDLPANKKKQEERTREKAAASVFNGKPGQLAAGYKCQARVDELIYRGTYAHATLENGEKGMVELGRQKCTVGQKIQVKLKQYDAEIQGYDATLV